MGRQRRRRPKLDFLFPPPSETIAVDISCPSSPLTLPIAPTCTAQADDKKRAKRASIIPYEMQNLMRVVPPLPLKQSVNLFIHIPRLLNLRTREPKMKTQNLLVR